MIISRFIVYLLVIASFLVPTTSFSCSCIEPRSPIEELTRSKSVFSGKVVEIKSYRTEDVVTFEVERGWKNTPTSEMTVVTSSSGASCGFSFTEGERYIVYTEGEEGNEVSLCSRTKLLAEASTDLEVLGGGKSDLPPPPEQRSSLPYAALLLGVAFLSAFYFFAPRRVP